jgi:hypothetical protein
MFNDVFFNFVISNICQTFPKKIELGLKGHKYSQLSIFLKNIFFTKSKMVLLYLKKKICLFYDFFRILWYSQSGNHLKSNLAKFHYILYMKKKGSFHIHSYLLLFRS